MTHQQIGKRGETIAAEFLQKQGYSIIVSNWHCPYGEIDIVAKHNDEWVFVEVRSRRAKTTESAFASISLKKRERMILAAQQYLSDFALPHDSWRIDVIGIALHRASSPHIEHVENALDW